MRILLLLFWFTFNCFSQTEVAEDSLGSRQEERTETIRAAPAPLQFDRDLIESLKQEPEFDYTEEVQQENWWTEFKRYVSHRWSQLMEWLFGNYKPGSVALFILEMIPYLIIAGIFIFFIWLFIRLNPGGAFLSEPQSGQVFLNEEEEIVQSKDIRKLIKDAISREDYRLAIRYYYLLVLQELSEKGVIEYQFPKTNEEYSAEIQQEPVKEQFRQITRIYDFIWYGSFEVTTESFRRAERDFLKMQEITGRKDE